jgi:hypothetical protein
MNLKARERFSHLSSCAFVADDFAPSQAALSARRCPGRTSTASAMPAIKRPTCAQNATSPAAPAPFIPPRPEISCAANHRLRYRFPLRVTAAGYLGTQGRATRSAFGNGRIGWREGPAGVRAVERNCGCRTLYHGRLSCAAKRTTSTRSSRPGAANEGCHALLNDRYLARSNRRHQ